MIKPSPNTAIKALRIASEGSAINVSILIFSPIFSKVSTNVLNKNIKSAVF
jgi:hypothetical protein